MNQSELNDIKIEIQELQSQDITSARRRFLIGMCHERDKARNREKYGRPKTKESEKHIAEMLHIAQVSVRRYAQYARALETIRSSQPELVTQVLSGKCTLPMKRIVEIAGMKKMISNASSIKDMPVYDPDAELTGLTLTVPSWIGSIERVKNMADLHEASGDAKSALATALAQLQEEILDIFCKIKEG